MNTFFADNVKSRRLLADGTYVPLESSKPRVRAQAKFHKDAIDVVHLAERRGCNSGR